MPIFAFQEWQFAKLEMGDHQFKGGTRPILFGMR